MARFSILAFFLAALVAAQVHAQTEPVVVKRPTELRKASSERSTSLATLAAQMPVNRHPAGLAQFGRIGWPTLHHDWQRMARAGNR
ncbi:MAG: hypothetical protein Q8R67_21965 [Rhodoferax sp.]|nr:hypothetical protein [Rhodoferax sp.]MDP3654340.1 hypothetical protein [Rhodoferax sp.]